MEDSANIFQKFAKFKVKELICNINVGQKNQELEKVLIKLFF